MYEVLAADIELAQKALRNAVKTDVNDFLKSKGFVVHGQHGHQTEYRKGSTKIIIYYILTDAVQIINYTNILIVIESTDINPYYKSHNWSYKTQSIEDFFNKRTIKNFIN